MRTRPLPLLAFLAALALVVGLGGCTRPDLHKTLRASTTRLTQQNGPAVLAAYQPWFGRPGHIDVGYSSQDRVVLERQVEQALQLGISGFVVNWYGPRLAFEDQSYALLQEVAAGRGFQVALMYDEDSRDPARATENAIRDLQYAYRRYISPQAEVSSANYLRYQGRPVVFIFPKGKATDWRRVREALQSWETPPLLIYKYSPTDFAQEFDGFFAWVHPGNKGWQPDGSNWGRSYLETFYRRMKTDYRGKIAVGAAWPGFDDSRASWSLNRRMDPRCGRTFEESLRIFRRFYDHADPLPFLMIVTWNDYEEGTAIEGGRAPCRG